MAAAQPEHRRTTKFIKTEGTSESLGLVFGKLIVCTQDGEPYYDTDNQCFTIEAMLKGATAFALGAQMTKSMHDAEDGESVFLFPITDEICKAFGFESNWEGLAAAYKPSPEDFKKYQTGEFTGFSVAGAITAWEDLD